MQPPVHEVFGLACGLSLRPSMARAHRHDDVELVLPLDGSAILEHSGGRHQLTDRSCAVFWAGRPHRVMDHQEGMSVAWLTVPLVDVLAWSLPAAFVGVMLRGGLVTFDAPPSLESAMGDWQHQIGASFVLNEAVRLEAHAWLLRASAEASASMPSRSGDPATTMARFISENFHRPLSVKEVASVVHVHPSTASSIFHRDMGVTIGEYLAQCRVAEAQRLLIASDASTSDVAALSGFGSTSRLYERFRRDTGMAPGEYRRRMR